ncbi:uncharacterized protein FIBRA_03809 [Fibroporia radiculosa]|uniref:Mitochondrial genome maintenance protein MGM101 n=1 Tax=Fibroporia radiculosa TaxID=599839 RepID=J4G6C9_9APHY|nr:uncharacterized protein FIBRA_03809 [Fibroporia radiculosa]CCM01743.1 predicted protein [Fibroporia radiculosa]
MASLTAARTLFLRPSSRVPVISARTYIAGRPLAPQSTSGAKTTFARPKVPAASTTTSAEQASAEVVPNEADIAHALSTPPESVPSSSVLAQLTDTSLFGAEKNGQSTGQEGLPTDWSKSYFGLSAEPFSRNVSEILLSPIDSMDVEIKPDGLLYLPEIKYRRVLNKAFGPGGWGLAPRSETHVGPKIVSREYALVCLGRLVAIARGEQEYFDQNGIPTATEACKSNALMRCCKDLGVASELWDPRFIREFKAKHCVEIFAEHTSTKKKKKLWRRKDQPKFDYPWKE